MTLRLCTVCGEPCEGSRCTGHRTPDTRTGRGVGHAGDDAVFRAISSRLRRASPFCQSCGARGDLTVDHIIPTSEAPELAREVLNMRVLCRSCNSRRGNRVSDAERQGVLDAIAARHHRRSRSAVMGRPVVRLSSQVSGGMPPSEGATPRGGRQNLCHSPRDGAL